MREGFGEQGGKTHVPPEFEKQAKKKKKPSLVWSQDSRSSTKIIYGVGLGKQTNKQTPNLSVLGYFNF